MANTSIRITGIDDVLAQLKEGSRAVTVAGFAKALRAGIDVINGAIKPPVDSGKLRAAQKTEVTVDAGGRGGVARVHFGKQGHVANWIESGHRIVTHKPGLRQVGFVAMRPFIRPAVDGNTSKAVDAFSESLAQTVNEKFGV